MPFGYNGKILHVNLSAGTYEIEEPEELFYRQYLGGGGMGAYYLLTKTSPEADPVGPDNVLVFAPSIVTGAPISGLSRFSVTAKSPLTGAIGDSQAGGSWGVTLKKSGFDALVVYGKASRPVYIIIQDGALEIRDAAHLWGRVTSDAEKIIQEEVGNPSVSIAQIGPGGEQLVRYACIVNDLSHFNGRTGMGAVMGSKNLKAIAVCPFRKLEYHDYGEVKELARKGNRNFKTKGGPQFLSTFGTSEGMVMQNDSGGLPTNNFKSGQFPLVDQKFKEELSALRGKSETCYGCVIGCKKKVAGVGREHMNLPEYESLAALGSYTGIGNIDVLIKANQLCSDFTLDTISTGAVIAFAMDCFEKGIITRDDTDGLELRFGNDDVLLPLIDSIAYGKGIGKILAEGSSRAAAIWGKEAQKLVATIKSLEVPAHLPHIKKSLALAYAVNPFGADHMSSEHDGIFNSTDSADREILSGLGIYETRPLDSLDSAKVRFFTLSHRYYSLLDTLNLCAFCFGLGYLYDAEDITKIVNAVSGWKTTFYELMLAAERRINMQRCFNVKAGFTREHDCLPDKLFQPLSGGITDGFSLDKDTVNQAIDEYYQFAGWNTETGYPQDYKLKELSLSWLVSNK